MSATYPFSTWFEAKKAATMLSQQNDETKIVAAYQQARDALPYSKSEEQALYTIAHTDFSSVGTDALKIFCDGVHRAENIRAENLAYGMIIRTLLADNDIRNCKQAFVLEQLGSTPENRGVVPYCRKLMSNLLEAAATKRPTYKGLAPQFG